MNKAELVKKVAEKTEQPQKQVAQVVEGTLEAIGEAVSDGEKVQLINFGAFEPRKKSAREGRNPTTGEKITIPAQTVPVFKPGKALKEKVK